MQNKLVMLTSNKVCDEITVHLQEDEIRTTVVTSKVGEVRFYRVSVGCAEKNCGH